MIKSKLGRLLVVSLYVCFVYELYLSITDSPEKVLHNTDFDEKSRESSRQDREPNGNKFEFKTDSNCNIQKRDVEYTRKRILEANLEKNPYPHLIIDNIFTPDVYGCILKYLKEMRSEKGLKKISPKMSPKEIETAQRSYNDLNMITHLNRLEEKYGINKKAKSFLKDLAVILNDAGVQQAWLHKFSGPLSSRRPKFDKRSRVFSRQLLTIDGSSYAILPHTDTVDKLVTVLIYLPEVTDLQHQKLGTLLLRKMNTSANIQVSGKQRADWKEFHVVKQAPFEPNVALAFSACDESWHAVREVGKMKEPRISLQTFIMKNEEAKVKIKEKVGPCSSNSL